jgi:hypothetical protein
VRFREDNPEDLDRARKAAREWRQQHSTGTEAQFVAAVGGGFRPDYAPVLRAVLFAADSRDAKITTGVSIIEDPS